MITVIGSSIIDFTFNTGAFPQAGETKTGLGFDQGYGGKGANQAAAAAFLGSQVGFVGKVGDDLLGRETIANFGKNGIDATFVTSTNKSHTGVASIMVTPNGENRIIVITGANDFITTADIDDAKNLLEKSDYLVLQYEIPLDVVYYVISKYLHKKIILNPAPAPETKTDMTVLSKAEYFIPNETEAAAVTGIKINAEDVQATAFANLERLKQYGFRNVIITLGSKGAAVSFENSPNKIIEGIKVNVKDTTGAGDAFIGSFTAFLSQGKEPEQAVKLANIYAGLSTENVGTQKSYLKKNEFEKYCK